MKKALLFFASFCLGGQAFSQCRILYNNYDLVFEETFDNISSTSQLSNVWQFVHDDPGYGWGDYVDPVTNVRTYGEFYNQSQVSIQPGGIMRLTAQRVDGTIPVWSNWLNSYRYPKYKSGMIQLRNDLFSDSRFDRTVSGCTDRTGFLYGMFEIRVKLPPSAECFPAFWLPTTGPTEIDIFEYGGNDRQISNNVIWWSGGTGSGCQGFFNKSTGNPLPSDWHTITCVWTPDKVTFFFDGRETRTVNSSQKATYAYCPASIIVNLAMNPWHNVSSNYMDVDYVRVYKPKLRNYNLSYKNAYESLSHDIFENATGTYAPVHSAANSIAPNTSNPNEIFYRGTDNYLYVATKGASSWNIKKLLFNDGSSTLAAGDVRYLPVYDMLLYVGTDNRINLFGRSTSTGTGFYHWCLTSNWSCYWCNSDDLISPSAGTLQTTPNGEVFYRGLDNKMHRYYMNGSNWAHQILSATYNPSHPVDFVQGDITIDPNNNTVFYKGSDNRLQVFYKDAGVYHQGWIDDNWATSAYQVNAKPGSMTWAPALNGVLYNGTDNKLHLYYWNTNWIHQYIPYSYASPSLGYAGADYLNGSIDWSEDSKALNYVGYDGRMQSFARNMSTGTWTHYWTDDFWNTDLFASYNSGQPGQYASVRSSPSGNLYYTRRNGHLSYFKYEPCETLNPTCNDPGNPRILLKGTAYLPELTNKERLEVTCFPNPATAYFTVTAEHYDRPFTLELINAMGQVVLRQTVKSGATLSVGSLSRGLYLLKISSEALHYSGKLQLQ